MKSRQSMFPQEQRLITARINALVDLPAKTVLLIECQIHFDTAPIHHRPSPSNNVFYQGLEY